MLYTQLQSSRFFDSHGPKPGPPQGPQGCAQRKRWDGPPVVKKIDQSALDFRLSGWTRIRTVLVLERSVEIFAQRSSASLCISVCVTFLGFR